MANERRRYRRVPMQLPTRVQGWSRDDKPWPQAEMTNTQDISSSGCALEVWHPLAQGQVLLLTLPLPKNFRNHDLEAVSYHVYALVRHVQGARAGLMFLGKNPPRGFAEHPGERLLLPGDAAPARAPTRHPMAVKVRLRWLDAPPGMAAEELTTTESLGEKGAVLRTSLPILKGGAVELQELGGPFCSLASIENVAIGPDNVPRLELRFSEPGAADRARDWLGRRGIAVTPPVTPPASPPVPQPGSNPRITPAEAPAAPPPVAARPTRPIVFERELFPACERDAHTACDALDATAADRHVWFCACPCHWGATRT